MKKILILGALISIFSIGFVTYDKITYSNQSHSLTQRGCCSHHGGVCGCSNGRQKCCDGTLSPSCQCFKDDKNTGLKI